MVQASPKFGFHRIQLGLQPTAHRRRHTVNIPLLLFFPREGAYEWAMLVAALNIVGSMSLHRAFAIGKMALDTTMAASYPALTVLFSLASRERLKTAFGIPLSCWHSDDPNLAVRRRDRAAFLDSAKGAPTPEAMARGGPDFVGVARVSVQQNQICCRIWCRIWTSLPRKRSATMIGASKRRRAAGG